MFAEMSFDHVIVTGQNLIWRIMFVDLNLIKAEAMCEGVRRDDSPE